MKSNRTRTVPDKMIYKFVKAQCFTNLTYRLFVYTGVYIFLEYRVSFDEVNVSDLTSRC